MTPSLLVLSAFLVGFLGSVHCIGMCGGIVGTLTLGVPSAVRASPARMFPYFLTYNAGRIASYAVAGALVGYLGAQAAGLFLVERVQTVGRIISGTFMVVLGLYLGGWWSGLVRLERVGAYLWRAVEPWGRRLLPVRNPVHTLGLGLV